MKRHTLSVACLGGSALNLVATATAAADVGVVLLYPYYTAKPPVEICCKDIVELTLEQPFRLREEDILMPSTPAAVDNSPAVHGAGSNKRKQRFPQAQFMHQPRKGFPFKGNNRRQLMQRVGHL